MSIFKLKCRHSVSWSTMVYQPLYRHALPNPANIVAWKPGWIWPQAFPRHSESSPIRFPFHSTKIVTGGIARIPFFFSKNLSLNCEVDLFFHAFSIPELHRVHLRTFYYCVSPTRTTLRVGLLFPILPTIWKSFTG